MSRGRSFAARLTAVAAISLAFTSACSSSGGGGSPGTAASSSASSGASGEVSAAEAAVAKISKPGSLTFPGPTTSVKPGTHKVAIIAAGLSGQGAKTVVPFVQDAVKAIGWTTPAPFDGQFQPTVQSGLIQQAVHDNYQGIFLVAITPSSVATAVKVANAAKIPVVCVNCGPDPNPSAAPDVIHSDPSSTGSGNAQAAEAIAVTGGKGKIAVFSDAEFGQTVVQVESATAYLKRHCPGCSVTTVKMTVKDAVAPGVPLFTAFLSSHPAGSVDVVIAPYDTAAAPFATAAQQAGRSDIKFISFGGLLPFYQQIAAGSPAGAIATVAAPIPYESWAAVDLMARKLAGQPLWDASNLPVEMITHANASEFDKSIPSAEPAGDFKAMFKKYWGVSS